MFAIDNYDFKGKRAIIRVDFNVPLNEKGEVTDDTRIRAAIPTIKKVLEKGGSVILMSHLGRPKKNPDPKFSLEQIVPAIEKRLGVKVMFAGDCMGEKAAEMAANLKPGELSRSCRCALACSCCRFGSRPSSLSHCCRYLPRSAACRSPAAL